MYIFLNRIEMLRTLEDEKYVKGLTTLLKKPFDLLNCFAHVIL